MNNTNLMHHFQILLNDNRYQRNHNYGYALYDSQGVKEVA